MSKEITQTPNNSMTRTALIRSLIADLGSKDGRVRQTAREKLVRIGRPAVAQLVELLENPNDILRWEGVKALSGIADPDSMPFLIRKLSDENEQVRWLAAEGLTAIGPAVMGPVLEEFLCDPESLRIQRGVRHILIGLSSKVKINELYDLIGVLNKPWPELHAPAVAYKILKNVGRSKTRQQFCEEERVKNRAA